MAIEGSITAYYDWLITKHPDVLPGSGLSKAEVRLPYEDEWEFAARGGDAGDSASYEAPYPYPISEQLDAYEWYYKDGDLPNPRRVAGKKPSSLGLYDMLGNVGEMVGGRFDMGGQQGAMIVRGRDITARETEINAAERKEFARYTTTGGSAPLQPNKHPYIGFRLALGSLKAITDDEKLKELAKLEEQINKRQESTVPPSEAVTTLPTLSTIEELSRAAEADPSKAMQLAQIYETQMGDDLKARKYYDLAAKQGLADATDASLQLLRKRFSETGATEIFVEEGRLLEEPLRDGINPPSAIIKQAGETARQREAFARYQMAARSGVAVGRMEMARCRWFGIGTTIDPKRAKKELDDLKENFPELKGLDALLAKIDKDIATARKIYAGDSTQGLNFRQVRPALKYLAQKDTTAPLGLVTQKAAENKCDNRVATFFYSGFQELAAAAAPALPDADAVLETGFALGSGCGVQKDTSKAISYFEKAMDLGDYTGYVLRGYQLLGFSKNPDLSQLDAGRGKQLMEIAAKAGHPNALTRMAKYYQSGTFLSPGLSEKPVPRRVDLAIDSAKKAAKQDYTPACLLLGEMHTKLDREDEVAAKFLDFREALRWFEKGADLGDEDCAKWARRLIERASKENRDWNAFRK
jgi:TPR repeat protein